MHYLLFYEIGEDYVSRRAEFRDARLEKAWAASAGGELMLGGALANPVDGAVLLFKGDSPEVAENFAKTDPNVTSGTVKRWHVREWKTVAGDDAATPLKPDATAAGKKELSDSSNAMGEGVSFLEEGYDGLIVRMWRARSTVDKSGEYVQHATRKVFPMLQTIEGHRGAYLLRRAVDGAIEFVVLTLWQSMGAIRKFAGEQPERAVVEPEARAVLISSDELVAHFEVIHRTEETKK